MYHGFQWISLTSGDRQILAVTDTRLQSPNLSLIIQSCEFLKGVLLHDFPAEVFIQRPNILKVKEIFIVSSKQQHANNFTMEHSFFSLMC